MSKRVSDSLADQLDAEFNTVIRGSELWKQCLKEEIDDTAKRYSEEINRTVPYDEARKYGMHLKATHTYTKTERDDYVAYKFFFAGTDENGTAYEKIANILEYGSSKITARRFQRNAVIRIVKGIEARALVRYKLKGGEI